MCRAWSMKFPVLFVAAAFAQRHHKRTTGLEELRVKESDRISGYGRRAHCSAGAQVDRVAKMASRSKAPAEKSLRGHRKRKGQNPPRPPHRHERWLSRVSASQRRCGGGRHCAQSRPASPHSSGPARRSSGPMTTPLDICQFHRLSQALSALSAAYAYLTYVTMSQTPTSCTAPI